MSPLEQLAAVSSFISVLSDWTDTSALKAREVLCLAQAVYYEARGEPTAGQIWVANVAINRTKSQSYPNSLCKVVYQPKQFQGMKNAKGSLKEPEAFKFAVEIAAFSMVGFINDPSSGATYFYDPLKSSWPWRHIEVAKVGKHLFLQSAEAQ